MRVKIKGAVLVLSLFLALSLVSASTIFSNSFNSLEEINSAAGVIQGIYSFVPGIEGDAIYLQDTSAVKFPNIGDLSNEGTIEFWVKPGFNIKELPKFSTAGLLEVGDFPFTDTFGIWVYRSEYGPVIPFELKDSEGNYKQAWSKVSSFKPDRWHHIAIVWKCNQDKPGKNYATVYVDGGAGKKEKKVCQEIELTNKGIRIGTTGYYIGRTKTVDKLEVFDYIKSSGQIKKDYKNFVPDY